MYIFLVRHLSEQLANESEVLGQRAEENVTERKLVTICQSIKAKGE